MKYTIGILLGLLSLFASAQDYSRKELGYKPVNLEEAVVQLQKIQDDSTEQKIMGITEDDFVAQFHLSWGMWMRNEWGLWKGKDLAKYFNSIGIFHPDDMSTIILRSYYRELTGVDWKLEEQVQYFQEYWKKAEKK